MPPRKTPMITCDYNPLRFFVCNLCAPATDTEQAETGHSEPGSGCSGGSDLEFLGTVADGFAGSPNPVAARSARVRERLNSLGGRGGKWPMTAEDERRIRLNHSTGRSGPYPASLFLERAVEHDGTIYAFDVGRRTGVGEHGGAAVRRELTVLSNFDPLYRLFMLAASEDLWSAPGLRDPGFSAVTLCDKRELPDTRDHLRAFVCYRHSDGFDIGVQSGASSEQRRDYPPMRGLRLERGTALIVYGGAAVGVAGWVKGRPVLLMAPEGTGLIEGAAGWCLLADAILSRWNERAR